MKKGYNVLFVTSEVFPYSKTGGLADVANSLPQALNSLGNEVRIITPKYGPLDERRLQIHEIKRLKDLTIDIFAKKAKFSIKSSFIHGKNTKAQIYLLENNEFYKNKGIYYNPRTKKEFSNNDERFYFFSKAVLEILEILQWKPDIILCNDWQTGLIPAMLKTMYKNNQHINDIKTVFTIHNLANQGIFPKSTFSKTGLPEHVYNEQLQGQGNKFNFLKTGILYADKITTVSQTYAKEILSDKELNKGLDDILGKKKKDFHGILSGIDYLIWNPSVDKIIPYRYTYQEIPLKYENKRELMSRFKIDYDEDVPLLGMITRLVDQKGFDLVMEIMPQLMKENVKMIILGLGEEKYHKYLKEAKKKYPDKLMIHIEYDEEMAHCITAGADMLLMPSKYEPCGYNQLYAMSYGTIPVVRNTGGLSDTIINYNKPEGTGFLFDKYSGAEFLKAIKTALGVYKTNKTKWHNMMRTAMSNDFSWKASGRRYMDLFHSITGK